MKQAKRYSEEVQTGPDHTTNRLFEAMVKFCLIEQEITARRRKSRELRQACVGKDEGGCPWLDGLCEACKQHDALAAERNLGKPRSLARKTLLRRFAKWQETIQKLTATPGGAE